jgi:hypothetical protein
MLDAWASAPGAKLVSASNPFDCGERGPILLEGTKMCSIATCFNLIRSACVPVALPCSHPLLASLP